MCGTAHSEKTKGQVLLPSIHLLTLAFTTPYDGSGLSTNGSGKDGNKHMSNSRHAGEWLIIFIVSGQTSQMLLLHCNFSTILLHLVSILEPGCEGEVTVTENSRVFRMRQ